MYAQFFVGAFKRLIIVQLDAGMPIKGMLVCSYKLLMVVLYAVECLDDAFYFTFQPAFV